MSVNASIIQGASIAVSILLAFAGYVATYVNSIRLENRRNKVKYISDQIQFLYGPLFSLSNSAELAWRAFRSHCRPGGSFFSDDPPPTDDDKQQWRLWIREIFMPINIEMERVIVTNAHLIEGSVMPETFRDLLAHIEVYKIVVKKWEQGDFERHLSYIGFPRAFAQEVADTYQVLKQQQVRLLKMV
jgi:hypothetical protein